MRPEDTEAELHTVSWEYVWFYFQKVLYLGKESSSSQNKLASFTQSKPKTYPKTKHSEFTIRNDTAYNSS